jgi:hypothetical protein
MTTTQWIAIVQSIIRDCIWNEKYKLELIDAMSVVPIE